jgi:hypothetical protein
MMEECQSHNEDAYSYVWDRKTCCLQYWRVIWLQLFLSGQMDKSSCEPGPSGGDTQLARRSWSERGDSSPSTENCTICMMALQVSKLNMDSRYNLFHIHACIRIRNNACMHSHMLHREHGICSRNTKVHLCWVGVYLRSLFLAQPTEGVHFRHYL